jgi:hypothetical protein
MCKTREFTACFFALAKIVAAVVSFPGTSSGRILYLYMHPFIGRFPNLCRLFVADDEIGANPAPPPHM